MEKKMSYQDSASVAWSANDAKLESTATFRPFYAWMIVLLSVAAGLLIAIVWNPAIADNTIGSPIANTVLGTTAKTVSIDNALFSIAFAIAAGLGTTFTACN